MLGRRWAAGIAAAAARNGRARQSSTSTRRAVNISLEGKIAFIAGVSDTSGLGWAISKQLADAGAIILVGTWPPALKVFRRAVERGDKSLPGGGEMRIARVFPLDAMFSTMEEVPKAVLANRKYTDLEVNFDVRSVAQEVFVDWGRVDILVHAMANAPEIDSPLLNTTRKGYLEASSASSYSMVALMQNFGPFMPRGSSAISLTYAASRGVVPGYGGGMSSAKAQLESDTRMLAWEAGRKWGVRVNAISAGPFKSRAASAIGKSEEGQGFIDRAIEYTKANSPLASAVTAEQVAGAALALCSPLGAGITGECIHVDSGMHAMGVAVDSESFKGVKT